MLLLTLTGVILAFAVSDAAVVLPISLFYEGGALVGMDYGIYMDRTHDWLAGDGFYRARQLTGLHTRSRTATRSTRRPSLLARCRSRWASGRPVWPIPFAIIPAALIRIRPPTWTWPIMAFALLLPRAPVVLILGQPLDMDDRGRVRRA